MKKYSEYIVLSARFITDLEKLVNEYIQNGYQPVGGIALTVMSDDNFRDIYLPSVFYQAMAR